eukprot:g74998.t1
MVELGIDPSTFKSLQDFASRQSVVRIDSKPAFIFQGEAFESDDSLKLLKNLLLDFFRGEVLDKINLASLDRLLVITAQNGKALFRHYAVLLKKSGSRIPRIELEEVGPRIDWTARRVQSASEEMAKQAMKVPKEAKKKLAKNIETSGMGDRMGRIHMERQDLSKLALAKPKALKKANQIAEAEAGKEASEQERPKKKRRKADKEAQAA